MEDKQNAHPSVPAPIVRREVIYALNWAVGKLFHAHKDKAELIREAVKALGAPLQPASGAPAVPEGFVLMPLKPTPQMLSILSVNAEDDYAALIAAAPSSPAVPVSGAVEMTDEQIVETVRDLVEKEGFDVQDDHQGELVEAVAIATVRALLSARTQAGQSERPDAADYETRHALMEGERNAACDEYFKARPQIDFIGNRRIFEAGFQRGFEVAPNQAQSDDRPCREELRVAGKVYPRTCAAYGIGPCRNVSRAAIEADKKGAPKNGD